MPENLIYTSVSTIPELVKSLSASFKTNKTLELEWRKKQLRQLSLLISENVPAFQEALGADLGRVYHPNIER